MDQGVIIIVRQRLHEKRVKFPVAQDQLLKGAVGDLVQGAGGFGNHRKFRRAGIEPFGADDKLVKADEAVRAEV